MAGLGGLVGGIGGAVGGLFAAEGYGAQADGAFMAAMSYRKAARMTLQNIDIEKSSAEMKNFQINRQVAKVGGAMVAAEGAANISGGSAGDLMRESIHEGAIATATWPYLKPCMLKGAKSQLNRRCGALSSSTG